MTTYKNAFNDGYEYALEEMGYVIDDREDMNIYNNYAEEGLYDLDDFIDDDSVYENYMINEAYDKGYADAMEALFKKGQNDEKGIIGFIKKVLRAVDKFITVTIPNFFRRLFGKDPRAKNNPLVKKINANAKSMDTKSNAIKAALGIAGGAAIGGIIATKIANKKHRKIEDGMADEYVKLYKETQDVKTTLHQTEAIMETIKEQYHVAGNPSTDKSGKATGFITSGIENNPKVSRGYQENIYQNLKKTDTVGALKYYKKYHPDNA